MMQNGSGTNGHGTNGFNVSAERHEYTCRGWMIPIEIVDLLDDGVIDPAELVLLTRINYFVTRGRGCYASNAYLAEKMKTSERTLRRMLSCLVKRGLLKMIYRDGLRYIETIWSRVDMGKVDTGPIAVTDEELDGDGSKMGTPDTFDRGSKMGTQDTFDRGSGQIVSIGVAKVGHLNSKDNNKGNGVPSGTLPPPEGFPLPGSDTRIVEKTYPRQVAEKLHRALAEKRKITVPPSLNQWTEHIREFLLKAEGVDRERLDRVLRWYCDHIGEKFVPMALSARGFVQKFVQIETQMQMQTGGGSGQFVDDDKPLKVTLVQMTDEEFEARRLADI